LSRGFDEAGYPATPPVSYQLNRQLAGWNPPPQVFRAFGAHQSMRTLGELAQLFASVHNTIESGAAGTIDDLKGLRANVAKLVTIAEDELNAVIDACLADLPNSGGANIH
jgi:hypothetical protein